MIQAYNQGNMKNRIKILIFALIINSTSCLMAQQFVLSELDISKQSELKHIFEEVVKEAKTIIDKDNLTYIVTFLSRNNGCYIKISTLTNGEEKIGDKSFYDGYCMVNDNTFITINGISYLTKGSNHKSFIKNSNTSEGDGSVCVWLYYLRDNGMVSFVSFSIGKL